MSPTVLSTAPARPSKYAESTPSEGSDDAPDRTVREFMDYYAIVRPENVDLEGRRIVFTYGKYAHDGNTLARGVIDEGDWIDERRDTVVMFVDVEGENDRIKLTAPLDRADGRIRAWRMDGANGGTIGIVYSLGIEEVDDVV